MRRLKVWYWNGEDPLEELQRRFAAAQKLYALTREDIEDRLYLNSGRELPIVIAEVDRSAVKVNDRAVQDIVAAICAEKIDVVVIDPFVACHRVPENDNSGIERVAQGLGADCRDGEVFRYACASYPQTKRQRADG